LSLGFLEIEGSKHRTACKEKENNTTFGANFMRSQELHWAAQGSHARTEASCWTLHQKCPTNECMPETILQTTLHDPQAAVARKYNLEGLQLKILLL